MYERIIDSREIRKIVKRYKSGETQQQIADSLGVTRQRIQQLLSKRRVSKLDGGARMKTFIRLSNTQKTDFGDRRSILTYGCSLAEVARINGGPVSAVIGGPAERYRSQRSNARTRGIGWEITFPEWWSVWEQSGKWGQRGRSRSCYVMARTGDTGPYRKDNVDIKTASENHKEGYLKTPYQERAAKRGSWKKSVCIRGHDLNETRGSSGNCRLCAVIINREYRARISLEKLKGGE